MPKDIEHEMVEFAVAMGELLDKGMSLEEVHDFIEVIYDANIRELLMTLTNGRMDD